MPPTLSTDEELAKYPAPERGMIRRIEADALAEYRYFTEQYDHTKVNEHGHPVHYDKDGRIMRDGPIGRFFSLTYASWLVLPRLALQEMPPDWQARFVDLMEEGYSRGLEAPEGDLVVTRKKRGKFAGLGSWGDYRRGTVSQAKAEDADEQ